MAQDKPLRPTDGGVLPTDGHTGGPSILPQTGHMPEQGVLTRTSAQQGVPYKSAKDTPKKGM